MPPTASPGVRGTQTELAPKACFFDTPSTAAILRKMRALVSWKKTSHLTPARIVLSSVLAHTRCPAEHQRARDADQPPPMHPHTHAGAATCAHRRGRAAWFLSCRPCLCTEAATSKRLGTGRHQFQRQMACGCSTRCCCACSTRCCVRRTLCLLGVRAVNNTLTITLWVSCDGLLSLSWSCCVGDALPCS